MCYARGTEIGIEIDVDGGGLVRGVLAGKRRRFLPEGDSLTKQQVL